MNMENILEQSLKIKKSTIKKSTHFAICNGDRIRYLVSLEKGKRKLVSIISSYSNKLLLLVKLLNLIPLNILKIIRIGYFVEVILDDEILEYINMVMEYNYKNRKYKWNMIVGTYNNKQKLVIQCFLKENISLYFKIGNKNSAKEMISEIKFLEQKCKFNTFNIPKMLSSHIIDKNNKFNIMVTEEFIGDRVKPIFNSSIYEIYKEISTYNASDTTKGRKSINKITYQFSHGDFAPWNIKFNNGRYIVFDWEHSRYRFYGFDIIHYVFQIETLLNSKEQEEAIEIAISTLKKYEKDCNIDNEVLKKAYFEECRKSFK